jgi:hypothetical protein
MKILKTASGKQTIKISKSEWTSIGKKAGWMTPPEEGSRLPMPLYDDINEINGKIMSWVEKYMDNYDSKDWENVQSRLYKEIADFCMSQV